MKLLRTFAALFVATSAAFFPLIVFTDSAYATCLNTTQTAAIAAAAAPTPQGETPTVTTIETCGGDDVSYRVPVTTTITFDGQQFNSVYATTNSVITFGRPDNTYWAYPTTPSISLYSMDWFVYPQAHPDEHLIINSSDGGFQVDIAARPCCDGRPVTNIANPTNIIITAAINTDGTVAIAYSVTGPTYEGQTRTGVRLNDGSIVTLAQYGVVQVETSPTLAPDAGGTTISPEPSVSPTSSPSPSASPSPSPSPTPTLTQSPEPSVSPSTTASPTPSPSASSEPSPTSSPSPSDGATATASPSPTASPVVEPTNIPTQTPDPEPSPAPQPSPAPTPPPVPAPQPAPRPEPIVLPIEPAPAPEPEPTPIPEPEPSVDVPVDQNTPEPAPAPEPPAVEEPAPSPQEPATPPSEEEIPTPQPDPAPIVPDDTVPVAPPENVDVPESNSSSSEPSIPDLVPNNPDQLPDSIPKLPPASALVPKVQVDKAGVENGGIEFFGTKTQPQVVGEDGKLTPPPPPPGSGLPLNPDAITTVDTFIGQPGGTTFNAPDIAVPVELVPVEVPAALDVIPGAGEAIQAVNQAYVALANIGNDMSPITRKKAKKILIATVAVAALTRRAGK